MNTSILQNQSQVAVLPVSKFSLVDRFLEMVATFPNQIAVSDQYHCLTYQQLAHAARALAEKIQAHTHAGEVIALFSPNTCEYVLGIWSILFSGRAYLPLDPASPAAWLETIQGQVGFRLALVARTTDESVELPPQVTRLGFDSVAVSESSSFSPAYRAPDSLLALFLTSGSTGTPKVVAYQDRHILFDALRQGLDLNITPADQFDLVFSGWFSASTACLFPALLHGSGLHLYDLRQSGLHPLTDWLHEREITISNLGVSTYRAMVHLMEGPAEMPHLRLLCLSAESVRPNDLALFNRYFPVSCTLQVAYASTEARTVAQWFFQAESSIPVHAVPLGTAVHGKEIVIENENGQPLPAGRVGEIVVRSLHIPSGYWSRGEKMSPSPSLDSPVTLRTGDLGMLDKEGRLWFEGRKDLQLKIRGLRIQPELIERTLRMFPAVTDAWVVAHDRAGLVAFYTSAGRSVATGELFDFLKKELVPGLIPQKIICLPEVPINSNGKPDRQALSHWPIPEMTNSTATKASADATLEIVLEAMRYVLETDKIAPESHFFDDLGGDSLQALEVWARICQRLNTPLPIDQFYFHPVPTRVAEQITRMSGTPAGECTVLALGDPSRTPVFCVSPSPSELGCYLHLARNWEQKGDLIGLRWEFCHQDSLDSIALQLAKKITDQRPNGPYCIIGFSFGGMLAYETARALEEITRQTVTVILLDTPTYRPTSWWWKCAVYPFTKPGYLLRKAAAFLQNQKKRASNVSTDEQDVSLRLLREFQSPRKPFSGTLVLFQATIPTTSGFHFQRSYDWEQQVAGQVIRHQIPATHDQMVQPEAIQSIIATLKAEGFI